MRKGPGLLARPAPPSPRAASAGAGISRFDMASIVADRDGRRGPEGPAHRPAAFTLARNHGSPAAVTPIPGLLKAPVVRLGNCGAGVSRE